MTGGEARKLCDSCGQIYGWSPDGRKIVYWSGSPIRFFLLDPVSLQKSELVGHPKYNIHGAELSPDQRWVAFHVPIEARREPLIVAPLRDGKAAAENEWVTIVDSSVRNQRPWWSPDGRLLYFISALDGFSCIWMQRLDPATKRPVGSPQEVYHFHSARRTLPPAGLAFFGPALGRDQMIFSTSEVFGNVWMAKLEGLR